MISPLLTIEVLTAILAFDLLLIVMFSILHSLDAIPMKGFFWVQTVLTLAWTVFLYMAIPNIGFVLGTIVALMGIIIVSSAMKQALDSVDHQEKRKRQPKETTFPARLEDTVVTPRGYGMMERIQRLKGGKR